jgi:hypothetical protein
MSSDSKRATLAGIRPRYCCVLLGLALVFANWRDAAAHSQSLNIEHVFFENSASATYYYYSKTGFVAPSALEVKLGQLPVDVVRFRSPPNSLRLKWTSNSGGDWRVTLKAPARFLRGQTLKGDTLSLWCYSEKALNSEQAPRIFIQDDTDAGLPTIHLLAPGKSIPAGKWTEIRLPLKSFTGPIGGTAEYKFDPRRFERITLLQNLDDGAEHVMYVDDIRLVDDSTKDDHRAPSKPKDVIVEGRNLHFDIAWPRSADPDVQSYRIYRSWDGLNYDPIGTRPDWSCRFVNFVNSPNKTAFFKVSAIDLNQNESPLSEAVTGSTRKMSDDELLDMVQQGCCRYYWEGANFDSGMAVEILPGDENLVATGASGFGIMALIVATERGFIPRDASVERMLKIVRFLSRADRFHGAWPHFLDGRTGRVIPYFGKYDDGGDLVETAFLVQGLLAARQYFKGQNNAEREIRETITALWRGVEWDWYCKTPKSDVLYWHWSPNHEWHISHPLIGWNETMIVYLLAIASPTHPVPASMYHTGWAGQSDYAVQYRRTWSRTTHGDHFLNGNTYYGIKLDVGSGTGGDLFFSQFSFLGFDPRGKQDRYTNYFANNRSIALINRAYCSENPGGFLGYGPNCWGLSAGINSGGGRPVPRDDNGTICCSAALGVFPYTPPESMSALKHFYQERGNRIWGVYGFHDGFNDTENWFQEVYMGLNQAQIVVGIENHRTGLLWRNFMANQEVEPALRSIGFRTADGQLAADREQGQN